jgi:hypothetical protein
VDPHARLERPIRQNQPLSVDVGVEHHDLRRRATEQIQVRKLIGSTSLARSRI